MYIPENFIARQSAIPRLTDTLVREAISNIVRVRLDNLKFSKLDESPVMWRHACDKAGICVLKPQIIRHSEFESFQFIFCSLCGAVHYVTDDIRR